MGPIQDFEQHARLLMEPEISVQARHQMVMAVRESLEIAHTGEYLNFLKCYFRSFSVILLQITKPQSVDNPEHKLRNAVLEILNRLPHSEVLRPFVHDLLKVAMQVLTSDNDENGLICIRIIFDLLRNFRPALENELQPFLDFVRRVYLNFGAAVNHLSENCDSVEEDVKPMDISDQFGISVTLSGTVGGQLNPSHLNPSIRSFKIIMESPLVVMFIFQLYSRLVQTNIPHLLPLMVTAISIPGPEKFPPSLRSHFFELKGAQVKTVSFMTYLLKTFAEHIRPHEESICRSIVKLLVTCSDSVTLRKELLVALKHVLSTEFRRGFFPLIDTLLEERVLVGTGRACFETLRPLAYSLLAEIVHHARASLSLSQISRIIYLFSRNMHDASLSISIHTTSSRLMLNLVECIFEKGVDQTLMDETRILLGRIMDTFVGKFNTFKRIIPQLLDDSEEMQDRSARRLKIELPVQSVFKLQAPVEHSKEVNDCKQLIRTLVMGMKTIIWSITHASLPRSQGLVSSSPNLLQAQAFKGLKQNEVLKASGVLKSGIHCLLLFKGKEEENMINLVCQIFEAMESRDITDIFSLCISDLFEFMLKNTHLLCLASLLLQSSKVCRPFIDVLVNFLVGSKLDVLKHPDSPSAMLVLQLFRFLLGAVAKAPSDCERILQPHVPIILEVCIKHASESDTPVAYLQLLRTLFRALAGGKFELIFRDLVPSLQPCLNMLLSILEGPTGHDMRDLVLELCLTLPARLSSLLPHLPRLMNPIVLCLRGSDDLVSLGLRTLEFWVDSLNPDFLEPSMANVTPDLFLALWSHLRPAPHPWGGKALQLLGKLGGRNRRFLKDPLALECKDNPEHGFRLILTFEPSTPFLVPLDRFINLAATSVMHKGSSTVDQFYRKQALKFLHICLCSHLSLPGSIGDCESTFKFLSSAVVFPVDPSFRSSEMPDKKGDFGVKTKTQLMAEKSVFKFLLVTIFATGADVDLYDPSDTFVADLCHHFAVLFHLKLSRTNVLATNAGVAGPSHLGNDNGIFWSKFCFTSNLRELDITIFLDALVEVLSDENRQNAKAALNALNMFSDTLLFLSRSKNVCASTNSEVSSMMIGSSSAMNAMHPPSVGAHIPVFEQLLQRLLHCCYGSKWQAQIGGVLGLGSLLGKVNVETLCRFQVKIVRALVYVLKKLPGIANKEQEEACQVLTQVLRVVNYADELSNEAGKQVVAFLAAELFNPNTSLGVRKHVQTCFSFLACRTGSDVSELLEPLHQPLLQPLIVRPLRTRTVDQQVGTVDALNFCLALRPPLVKWTQELVSFLQEALQIAEADETVWAVKFMNPKITTSLNKLRTVCIELLCTAMALSELKTLHSELRSRIISMFFKSLACRTPEIVVVAKDGLRQVVNQQRMPKDLLQTSLRPILVNLAQTKTLSMPLLEGLARLLELLSHWFNVTLGGKLLEHLRKWLEPESLAQGQKAWKSGEEPKIAAAIVELFHLLPPAAHKFLDELVTLIIDLEKALPPGQFYSEINSPYIAPLTKYLNRHAALAVDYFLQRLGEQKFFKRFMNIVGSDAGVPLREELANSAHKILVNAFPDFKEKPDILMLDESSISSSLGNDCHVSSRPESSLSLKLENINISDAYFHGIFLIYRLTKMIPGWLHKNRLVFDTLVHVWRSPTRICRLQNEQELNFLQVNESKWLVKCFLTYLRHDQNEVNILFNVISIFLYNSRTDYSFLKEFYIIEVSEGYAPHLKKKYLLHFLDLFHSKLLQQDHLVVSMQMLILPMLNHAFQNGQTWEVIDPSIIKIIVEKLLDPPDEVAAEFDEPLRIELLQLATLLLKYLHTDLVQHRKELIKFGWNHLKREDSISKQWAFVNVCQFLEAYQAPEKIILQVFIALLRTCQPENKHLVRQALDILMPSLPRRLPLGDPRMPAWTRYAKKILVEEGHTSNNMIHIFQLIVRHSDLFYSSRAHFVPQMVNALNRLGLPCSAMTENRRLAIELAGLVVSWEKQRQNEMKAVVEGDTISPQSIDTLSSVTSSAYDTRHAYDGSTFPENSFRQVKVEPGIQSISVFTAPGAPSIPNVETPTPSGQPDDEFKPNAALEEMVISFLIRVALVIEAKDKEGILMYKQAMDLLSRALDVWPTVNVKFNYLEKLLSSMEHSQLKDPATPLAQGLDVMNRVLEKQPQLFIRNNINQIIQSIEPCFKHKMPDGGKSTCSIIKIVFSTFPADDDTAPHDVKLLYQKINENIQTHIGLVNVPQSRSHDHCVTFVVSVIRALAEVRRSLVDSYILVSTIHHLVKDMFLPAAANTKHVQRTDTEPLPAGFRQSVDMASVINNLIGLLRLISGKTLLFPEHKRALMQSMNVLLSEKSTDPSVLLSLLDIVKNWVEDDSNETGMTSSSSAGYLSGKEVISFLQKLSQVDKQNFSPDSLVEWDSKYLHLLYGLCSDSHRYQLPLRQEVFQRVERQFLLGLRARDPKMRAKFFAMYNDSLGRTLFARLQYIFQMQDWEALSDVFWLKQGLDLLLALLVEDKCITLAPNSAKVPPITSLPETSGNQFHQSVEVSDETGFTFDGLIQKHSKFLNEMSTLKVCDLLEPLRELAHTDANVAFHMWVLVFPIIWVTLHKEEQMALAKPIIALLSKDYHKKQHMSRPNVVQALLEGIQLSHPQPRMPSELIKYIGKTYNVWHISLLLLESHVMFMNDVKCSESLADLYRLLNEEDMRCGLWKKRSVTAETKAGLSLIQHGYLDQAQGNFYQALVKATQGAYNTVASSEMCLWEEQWLYCAAQLGHWDALADFGKSVENYEILLDNLWKLSDWTYMKDHVFSKAQMEETAKVRLVHAFYVLHERNSNAAADLENIIGKATDLALERWWQLPEMCSHSRVPLLQQFQQIIEVQESSRILLDLSRGSKPASSTTPPSGSAYADLKDILETWKLRTPNDWDHMSVWFDQLHRRNELYNVVVDAFKDLGTSSPQLHHLGFRDKAWNVNKLARISRKQGLFDTSIAILDKMYGHSTMEVQEAFVKIKEQAKAYLDMKGELAGGLSLINNTNLDYFQAKHKAEIIRLKGEFLSRIGDGEEANVCFSNALSLFKNLPKGWISWGIYCDMAHKDTHEEIWLEYAVSCFLQGIKFGIRNPRSHVAYVLYLLSFDTADEAVGRAFDRCMDQVPHWVWLPWIPQLLVSLQRPEASHCKAVLLKIGTVYPQALYYWIRTYLLERRELGAKSDMGRTQTPQQRLVHQSVASSAASGTSLGLNDGQDSEGSIAVHSIDQSSPSTPDRSSRRSGNSFASIASAFDAARDVMEALRSKHSNLAAELETLLTELGSKFVTLPDERLLAVVNALLHRCYKYPSATATEVPPSLRKELSGVCRACFSADAVNKHVDFVREYKEDFERDLDPESSSTFPGTLSELTDRLKRWKNLLQNNVEDRFPAVLKLEEESKVLRDLHVVDVELPGQYFTDQEITPDHSVKLDRIGADVPIVRRHGSSFRRLTFIGSDGSERHFIVQTSLTLNARSEERMIQLFRVMNQIFNKNKESRRRHLFFHAPVIIPVWSQVRLVEDDVMYATFLEVYDNHCARNGREADLPIAHFKEQLNRVVPGQTTAEEVLDIRLRAYADITKNIVTDGILSQYMYKIMPNGSHLWSFKKQFAVQLALSCFVSFMLQIGGRSPNKILFAKNTGKMFHSDFHPVYDSNGMIESNEPVPFRLTRNIQGLFSHFGVDGLIVSAIASAAQAVVSPKQSRHLWYHLAMFFRDELLSWSWRRPAGVAGPSIGISQGDLKDKITVNVDSVVARVTSISPGCFLEEDEDRMIIDQPQSVQRGVADLVEAALAPRNLCMMDPTWHPWF